MTTPADRLPVAASMLGKPVRFSHEPDGPVHRVRSVTSIGMVTLHDMDGAFAPHLFHLCAADARILPSAAIGVVVPSLSFGLADILVEDAETSQDFAADLAALGVALPLTWSDSEPGAILDAAGNEICTVDVNRARPDAEAEALAAWIVCAVNTCAGFRAVAEADPACEDPPSEHSEARPTGRRALWRAPAAASAKPTAVSEEKDPTP
jgi:hypothetical protein